MGCAVSVIFLLFGLSLSISPVAGQTLKKYPLKSGVIAFEQTGALGNAKVIVYFDDYGIRERHESYDTKGNLTEVRFTDGKNMYKIDHRNSDDKVGWLMGSGTFGTEMKFEAEPFRKEKQKKKHHYKRLPDMNILGRKCNAYSTESRAGKTTFAGWNNILLYSEVKTKFGDTLTRAVRFDENATVSADRFQVPAGYEVKTP